MIPAFFIAILLPTIILVGAESEHQSILPANDIPTTTTGLKVNTNIFKSTTDGFHLWNVTFTTPRGTSFGRRLRLQKRNYHPQNITFNHTVCVSALQWYWYKTGHSLRAMFSLRTHGSPPVQAASMVMNFSYDKNSKGYNIMHSRLYNPKQDNEPEESEEEDDEDEETNPTPPYALPPPQWQFLYVEDNCTVVQLLNLTSPAEAGSSAPSDGKQQLLKNCELWDIYDFNESTNCLEYFKCYCDLSNVTAVNRLDLCWGRTQSIKDAKCNNDNRDSTENGDEEEEEEDEDSEDEDSEEEQESVEEEKEGEEAMNEKEDSTNSQKGTQGETIPFKDGQQKEERKEDPKGGIEAVVKYTN